MVLEIVFVYYLNFHNNIIIIILLKLEAHRCGKQCPSPHNSRQQSKLKPRSPNSKRSPFSSILTGHVLPKLFSCYFAKNYCMFFWQGKDLIKCVLVEGSFYVLSIEDVTEGKRYDSYPQGVCRSLSCNRIKHK